jgi:hypothetical protein
VAWVRSETFAPPKTGRLSMIAWLKISDPQKQPKLRLALEGKLDGKAFYRRANVGQAEDATSVKPLTTDWAPYRFAVNDLPLTGLADLRIGFDLMGEGEVWIDDVQLFDLWFEEAERDELLKNIATADLQRTAGRLPQCNQFLEGYWPQFLLRHVALETETSETSLPAPVASAAAPARPKSPARAARAERRENRGQDAARSPAPVPPENAPAAKPGMIDRMKSWLPRNPFR